MGPDRSLRRLAQQLDKAGTPISATTLAVWSRKFGWPALAAAHDARVTGGWPEGDHARSLRTGRRGDKLRTMWRQPQRQAFGDQAAPRWHRRGTVCTFQPAPPLHHNCTSGVRPRPEVLMANVFSIDEAEALMSRHTIAAIIPSERSP
jgi:hypothetical protein